MSDFIEKATDMYRKNEQRFQPIGKVLDEIRQFTAAMGFVELDLRNVEEVLSMFEMRAYAGDESGRRQFAEFLGSVVQHYTPAIEISDARAHFDQRVSAPIQQYVQFVANLMGVRATMPRRLGSLAELKPLESASAKYSVITLNYDRVIESCEAAIRLTHGLSSGIVPELQIAKLHGDVSAGNIVAPTWLKGGGSDVQDAWRAAHRLLQNANQIRFIGFSLPQSDTYMKYLIASALAEARHVRRIDAICLDPKGDVQARYRSIIRFRDLRFANARVEDYFGATYLRQERLDGSESYACFDRLESLHAMFMTQFAR